MWHKSFQAFSSLKTPGTSIPTIPYAINGVSRRIYAHEYASMEKRCNVASAASFVHLGGCPPLKTWVVGRCEKVFATKMEGATKKRFVKRCRRKKMRIGRCFFVFVWHFSVWAPVFGGIFEVKIWLFEKNRSKMFALLCCLVVLQLRRLWEDVFLWTLKDSNSLKHHPLLKNGTACRISSN